MLRRASILLALGLVVAACGGSEFGTQDGTGGASSGGAAATGGGWPDASTGASGGSTGASGGTGGAGGGSAGASGGAAGSGGGQGGSGVGGDAGTVDAASCGTGYVCVPSAPSGWSGPVKLFAAASGPPACAETKFQGKAGLGCPPAACTCTCAPIAGTIDCNPKVMPFWNGSCTASATGSSAAEACTPIPANSTHVNPIGISSTGNCSLTNASKSVPPETWSTNALACAAKFLPQGCSAGEQCTEDSELFPFRCVHKAGDVACPAGAYSKKRVFYTGHNDDRDCSCNCGNQLGVQCNAQLEIHGNASCSSLAQSIASGAACTALAGGAVAFKWSYNPTPGNCSGYDTKHGACTPTGAETFCCTQ